MRFVCKRVEWCCVVRLLLLRVAFVRVAIVECVCIVCGVLCDVVSACSLCNDFVLGCLFVCFLVCLCVCCA